MLAQLQTRSLGGPRDDNLQWLNLILAILFCFVAHCRTVAQTTDQDSLPPGGWYMGRQIAPTMSASGADWLIRKTREQEEQPRLLIGALQLEKGQHVCDFGCGNGYYSLELAKRVGPLGTVLAVDIQQEMLDLLQERAQPRGLEDIKPILATATNPRLPPGALDLVLMVDVYHELSHPAEILQVVRDSLNETGLLVLVEFREEDPNVPILPLHKMSQAQVIKEITANNFKLVRQFDKLPWQHVLFFAKQESSLPVVPLIPWDLELSNDGKSPDRHERVASDPLPAEPAQAP